VGLALANAVDAAVNVDDAMARAGYRPVGATETIIRPMRNIDARFVGVFMVVAVASLGATANDARAEVVTGPCATVMDPNDAPIVDSRLDHLVVDGVHVNVLLPPRYRVSERRYPVIYLFHGAFGDEDSFSTQTDLLAFTAQLKDDEQAIAVMPDGGRLPIGLDWADGTHRQETFVIGTLLPFVDARYRTLADGGHRAAAGFSAGGLDATVFAARHPDLFSAAGSFSGFVDPFTQVGFQVAQLLAGQDDQLCGGTEDWTAFWGDPAVHPIGWERGDPTVLAGNLEDVAVYVGSDNGVPCPDDLDPDPFLVFAEQTVFAMSQALDGALTAAGIGHTTEFLDCGLHRFSNADHDLRSFWPQMLAAFGRRRPSEFDYRTADASATVWGWALGADPARAPKFLDVRRASRSGMVLTGSGAESVTTGPLFSPGQRVVVSGAGSASPRRVRANERGCITFTVDLGPAHALEQDTADEQTAAAADPGYFVTRDVRFTELADGSEDE
jgi:S-formylglutathione hydrolase FrmB